MHSVHLFQVRNVDDMNDFNDSMTESLSTETDVAQWAILAR